MARILIIEDNEDLAEGVRASLEIDGHEAEIALEGEVGLARARSWAPDLIVLDLMLPDVNGYRVLRTLREEGSEVPVLILTAQGDEADKVLGFRLGADDYVTKPFGRLELLARVGALLRRRTVASAVEAPSTERFGDIEVNPGARTVTRRGEEIQLTPKEFDLLLALMRRRGQVASRLELLRDVWGHRAAVMTRTVDLHVFELRRKLEDDPSNPQFILTVRKAGYRFSGAAPGPHAGTAS